MKKGPEVGDPCPGPVSRLARELLGDHAAGPRRRAMIDEARTLARQAGDPGTIAEVLDSALHALWDPAACAVPKPLVSG
jgi:hypothetical protein